MTVALTKIQEVELEVRVLKMLQFHRELPGWTEVKWVHQRMLERLERRV